MGGVNGLLTSQYKAKPPTTNAANIPGGRFSNSTSATPAMIEEDTARNFFISNLSPFSEARVPVPEPGYSTFRSHGVAEPSQDRGLEKPPPVSMSATIEPIRLPIAFSPRRNP